MVKILHLADLHLDASFAGSGMTSRISSLRRQQLRDALKRIMDLAQELEVDAVTVGGDLYEQDRCTLDTANFVRLQFERIAPISILIAPGNHDPWVPYAIYRQVKWPSNVFIFTEQRLQPYEVGNVTVWGAGHNSPAVRENLVASVEIPPERTHLLLLHGSDTTRVPPGKVTHCPLSPEDVRKAGFAAGLLGHYHKATSPLEGQVVYYPGSPEPLGFDEEGRHYVLLLEIQGDRLTPELIEINNMNYVTVELDITEAETSETIAEMMLREREQRDLRDAFVRIRLVGTLHPDVDLDTELLRSAMSEHFGFLDLLDETRPSYDLDLLREEATAKGLFVRKMLERLSKADDEERGMLESALILGLQAFDGRELRPS